MTIYLLQWKQENETDCIPQRFATSSYQDVRKRFTDLTRESIGNTSIIIEDEETAVKKCTLKGQKDVIDLINSLN